MFGIRCWIVAGLLACFLRVEGADKYTDENRPYEFGFNIEGEQHRHEQKDENGIIMGEFGFITADGVYHVTVYATDETGSFRILSMKNIRVKPYPTDSARQGGSRALQPSAQLPQPAPRQPEPVSLEPPVKSCSHCSIPTSPKPPPVNSYDNYEQFPPYDNNNSQYPGQNPPNIQNYPQQNYPQQNYPQDNYPQQDYPQDYNPPGSDRYPKQYNPNEISDPQNVNLNTRIDPNANDRFTKPMLISAQMQIVDPNTDINHIGPGEREGLPNGLKKDDMMLLLYTFNYTVGFHGHHEEGYTNGAKKGYYYVTGRNGLRTRIDYTADDQGFHPKISQEVLDLISEDVPKPETEKDAKYGLKGYEFKWIYYPVNSKR